MDPRKRYTLTVIKNAAIDLLQEKTFNKITVGEVCSVAGINRSTFYRYFSDVFQLKEELENDCIQQLTGAIPQHDHIDGKELLKNVFQTLKQECYLSGSIIIKLDTGRISSSVIEFYRPIITSQWRTEQPNIHEERLNTMFSVLMGALTAAVSKWIDCGMPDDYENLFRVLQTLGFYGLFGK